MEYKHSDIVDPSTYDLEGLCDGIDLRCHKYQDFEDIGTLRAQEDWRKWVGPVDMYRGGLGPKYSFMSVSVPECLPERLEIISYANEFAFLHDDVTDVATQAVIDKENNDMLSAFSQIANTGRASFRNFGKKRIQGQILLEMMALDRPRALTTAKSWATFVQTASGKEHHKNFKTLDEYLPYRSIDVGQMFWHGMVTFGMALTIPEHEMPLCEKLMLPAWHAASLQNDLFSWEKEYRDAKKHGQADVVNAIWVIMKEHNMKVDQAKVFCRKKIKEAVADYVKIVERTKKDLTISLDLRKYIEAMQYSLSGNVVWSLSCPRYHEKKDYNELQLLRMKHGVKKYPTKLRLEGRKQRGFAWLRILLVSLTVLAGALLWGSSFLSHIQLPSHLLNLPQSWSLTQT
ncbi:isoprenoid synthase domain-containing protein [Massariosphaeria phaeospora]|uniref:Terpene synthase n=1 Tax=Massariosphaeria phaeospora TaxID=100035 RepID=A0A7C8HZE2_9PLEO|nr:isoprenoid synthase domain-containing protein [Massariosphaeria phaeospora]